MTAERKARRPALSTFVRRALEGECALPGGSTLLVAVSGGPDSMALLAVLARLGPRLGLRIIAHGVDHGLRSEAARELDLAATFAESAGVSFERSCVTVPRGGNLQARARDFRWKALAAAARRHGAAVATAHHADDRAETLLIRLLRGAGCRGLAVLPPKAIAPGTDDVTLLRPLLRAERQDVLTHLDRHGIPFAVDASNEDPRYLRTRIRQQVLPLLAALDPAVVHHLEALADELAASFPADLPAQDRSERTASADSAWIAALPRPTQEALTRLLRAPSSDAKIWLPGGLVASLDPNQRRGAPRRPGGHAT